MSIFLFIAVIAVSAKSISMGIDSRRNLNKDDKDKENEDLNIDSEKKSISDEIYKLKKMYDEGLINEEEFKKAKNKILN